MKYIQHFFQFSLTSVNDNFSGKIAKVGGGESGALLTLLSGPLTLISFYLFKGIVKKKR